MICTPAALNLRATALLSSGAKSMAAVAPTERILGI